MCHHNWFVAVLGIEPKAARMLGKHSTSEPHLQPRVFLYHQVKMSCKAPVGSAHLQALQPPHRLDANPASATGSSLWAVAVYAEGRWSPPLSPATNSASRFCCI